MLRRKIALLCATLCALVLLVSACNKAGSSPTATYKAFYDAAKKNDVQGIKNALSKKSLAMLEAFAQMGHKSLDDALKEGNSKPLPSSETQNEKITGDTATLDVKDENGKWVPMPFVKEDGQWKIAFDQYMEKAFSQMGSETPPMSPEKGTGEQPKGEGEQPTPQP